MSGPPLIAARFELEACVSEGGMGRLFRARDRRTGELLAVKLRRAGASATRFAREAAALAQLGDHPHVVRYVADGEDAEHGAYLAMEWLEGEDLGARLQRGPLGYAEAWRIGREASAALAHAHKHGFVHRDLKPGNLFLCREGSGTRVKLLDFGIVRQSGVSSGTQTGAAIGTPPYMAPEQVRGEASCGPAADVFALGCVLWECVVGHSPFRAPHAASMLAKILYDPSPSLRSELPSAPLALHTLLARMMAKRVDERIADGAELHALFVQPLPSELASSAAPAAPAPFAARERSPVSLVVIGSGVATGDQTPLFGALTPGMREPELRAAVRAHGGRLEQLADGSALVTFDVGLPAVEQARAAAACALAVRELCRPRNLCLVSGRTAPDEPSPVSRTVERASDLLRVASADRVYVDDLSATLIDAAYECEGVGELRTLRGPRRGLKRAGAPLMGRRFELSALLLAWEEARHGTARSALIVGEAGLGKSRLVAELLDAVAAANAVHALWVGRGDPLRADSALDLLRRVLGAGLGVDTPGRAPPDWLADDAVLAELLGLAAPGAHELEPQLRQRRAAEAVARCLAQVSQGGPLLLVLEDVHWADAASLHVLALALEQLRHAPLYVVATARPSLSARAQQAFGAAGALTLRLPRLDLADSRTLVQRALGGARADAAAIGQAAALGEGIPFFLEELGYALSAGRAELPDSVLSVVDARLSQLDDDERAVLAAASLFGTRFWDEAVFAVLAAEGVSPLPHAALERLCEAQLLVPCAHSHFAGARELTFRHALLREGALARLTRADAARGHLAAAEWLVSAGETDPAVLAHHFARGGAYREAARQALRASQQARAAGDFALAESLAEAALEDALDAPERAALSAELAHLLAMRGDYARSAEHARATSELAAGHPHIELAMTMMALVERDEAPDVRSMLALWDTLIHQPVAPGQASVWCPAFSWTLLETYSMGYRAEAVARVAINRSAGERFVSVYPGALLWGLEAQSCCELGAAPDPYATLLRVRAASVTADQLGDAAARLTVLQARVQAEAGLGLFAEARELGRALQPALLYPALRYGYVAAYARVLIALGEHGEAEQLLSELTKHMPPTAPTDRGRMGVASAALAEARADFARAQGAYTEATTSLRRVPPERAEALLAHARLCLELGELARARALTDEAAQLLLVLLARGYVGRLPGLVALGRAELAWAEGAEDGAAAHHAEATRLRDAVARRIADADTRAAYLTRLPENVRLTALAEHLRGRHAKAPR